MSVPRRYLYHSSSNPEAAFQSAKILRRIANYPNIQNRLVGDFTHDQVYEFQVLKYFFHQSFRIFHKMISTKQKKATRKQKYRSIVFYIIIYIF